MVQLLPPPGVVGLTDTGYSNEKHGPKIDGYDYEPLGPSTGADGHDGLLDRPRPSSLVSGICGVARIHLEPGSAAILSTVYGTDGSGSSHFTATAGKIARPRLVICKIHPNREIDMRKLLVLLAVSMPVASLPIISSAHGCIKGAAVGGVVGHVAGHHAVAGAAVGCIIGHHQAKVKEREAAQTAAQSQNSGPGATGGTQVH
jgi:hypothetical protein